MVQIKKTAESILIRAEERSITYQQEMMKAIYWLPAYEWRGDTELVYYKEDSISLVQWSEKEKSEIEVLEILEAFMKIQREMEAYLMDEEKVIYDPEWIFWDSENKVLRLLYVPWDFQNSSSGSFVNRFVELLWNGAINGKWQNERLILMFYRMQIAVKHQNQPQLWVQWIEQEKKRINEKDKVKEQALDILTEKEPVISRRAWLQKLKNRFPIVIR